MKKRKKPNTLAKRVLAASTISEKLKVIRGEDDKWHWLADKLSFKDGKPRYVPGIESLHEVIQIVYFALSPAQKKRWRYNQFGPDTKTQRFAALGHFFMVQVMDRDDTFFSRLAEMLRAPRRQQSEPLHWLYFDILSFCSVNKCGTVEAPVDLKKLFERLKSRGYTFSACHENQVPGQLRNTCKRIGVVY